MNEQIESSKVRLVDEDGTQLGILSIEEAVNKAKEKKLDLVDLDFNNEMSVCKLLDYKKYLYDQKKRSKELKKKNKKTYLKEIKLRPNISVHDYNFKLNHILSFLEKGNKIKVTMQFKGRQMAHIDLGQKVITQLKEDLMDKIIIERDAKLEGRQIILYLASIKNK